MRSLQGSMALVWKDCVRVVGLAGVLMPVLIQVAYKPLETWGGKACTA